MAQAPPFYRLRMTNGSGQGSSSADQTPIDILQEGFQQGVNSVYNSGGVGVLVSESAQNALDWGTISAPTAKSITFSVPSGAFGAGNLVFGGDTGAFQVRQIGAEVLDTPFDPSSGNLPFAFDGEVSCDIEFYPLYDGGLLREMTVTVNDIAGNTVDTFTASQTFLDAFLGNCTAAGATAIFTAKDLPRQLNPAQGYPWLLDINIPSYPAPDGRQIVMWLQGGSDAASWSIDPVASSQSLSTAIWFYQQVAATTTGILKGPGGGGAAPLGGPAYGGIVVFTPASDGSGPSLCHYGTEVNPNPPVYATETIFFGTNVTVKGNQGYFPMFSTGGYTGKMALAFKLVPGAPGGSISLWLTSLGGTWGDIGSNTQVTDIGVFDGLRLPPPGTSLGQGLKIHGIALWTNPAVTADQLRTVVESL